MINDDEQLDREVMGQWAAEQAECAVMEKFTVEELLALGPEGAAEAIEQRAEAIANLTAFPLTHCWVPDDWWLFLLELCEKRLQFPGAVLELFVPGGIRAGKSYIAAMLMVAHWLYTRNAFVFCLSETEETSKDLQQAPIDVFMPPEVMSGERGAIKQSKHEKMKFSGGAFTGGAFERYMQVTDENGVEFRGGGKVRFRYYSQSVKRYRGFSLTTAWPDEACPVEHLEAIYDRLATGAVKTREVWHVAKMRRLVRELRALVTRQPGAVRPHVALLGALMHGVSLWTYTPEEGFTPGVRRFLQGATKPDEFKVVVPELVDKPGVKDARAPKIAYPAEATRLVGYLWTSANRMVNAYPELSRKYRGADEATIRIKLCGDAEAAESTLFSCFGGRHIVKWQDVPRNGTLYLVTDPGFEKSWAITIYLVDAASRVWVLMRWPSPGWKVMTADGGEMDPGAWAVPTKGDRLNGDKGPAQKMRLDYTLRRYTRLVYEMLRRVLVKFAVSGGEFEGTRLVQDLTWEGDEGGETLTGVFAWPAAFIGDKRWMGNKVQQGAFKMTLHAALQEVENALPWEIHEGNNQREGLILIQNALSANIGGMPGLLVVDECRDTIFALNTYTVPEGKDAPPESDQACKEDIDMLRYLLMWGAWFNGAQDEDEEEGGGSY